MMGSFGVNIIGNEPKNGLSLGNKEFNIRAMNGKSALRKLQEACNRTGLVFEVSEFKGYIFSKDEENHEYITGRVEVNFDPSAKMTVTDNGLDAILSEYNRQGGV